MKAMAEPKGGDYFGGYYDFLINEGSYKFWAVFQVRKEKNRYKNKMKKKTLLYEVINRF